MTPVVPILESEGLVAQWRDVRLTTHRVYRVAREGRGMAWTSLALDRVEWVSVTREHQPILLLLAGIVSALLPMAGIALLLLGEETNVIATPFFAGAMLAGILAIAYFLTRHIQLSIGAGSGKIEARVGGASAALTEAWKFLAEVESTALATRLASGLTARPATSRAPPPR